MPVEPATFRFAYCPSCERYIGSAGRCPYCECDAYRPPALNILRIGAVTLATLGLLLLYAGARARPIPRANIDRLVPMMNYAVVQLSGSTVSKPYIGRNEAGEIDYLAVSIAGTSGRRVRVQAYGTVATALASTTPLPEPGAAVTATGQLQVGPGASARLRLRHAADLHVHPPTDERR